MSDFFTVMAGIVALGAPVAAGPVGPVEVRPAIVLHKADEAHDIVVSWRDGSRAGVLPASAGTVSVDELPRIFLDALKATEDADFDRHMGIDPAGLARAAIGWIAGGRGVGGSTLTQQLAKNAVTGSDRTVWRKLAEMISAVQTEAVLSKNEILESYANAVFFGRRSDGARNAARNWFGKDWASLDTGEIAFLAGVLQAPSGLDPQRNPDTGLARARARRDHVLERMVIEGVIDQESRDRAMQGAVETIEPRTGREIWAAPSDARFWATTLARRLVSGGGSKNGGLLQQESGALQIVLPLDRRAQEIAAEALDDGLRAMRDLLPDGALANLADLDQPDVADALGRLFRIDESSHAVEAARATLMEAARAAVRSLPPDARRAIVLRHQGDIRLLAEDGSRLDGQDLDTRSRRMLDKARHGDVFVVTESEPGEDRLLLGRPAVQGAVVAIDVATGRPIASVGGVESWASQFDRTQARRQPGSTIKPFLWLAALERGYPPGMEVEDAPIKIAMDDGIWRPSNYGGGSQGWVPLYRALELSLNNVAVRLSLDFGPQALRDMASRAGAYDPAEWDDMRRLMLPSAALGSVETTPERMARAVAALDPHHSTIARERDLEALEAMMRGVLTRGTAWRAFQDGPDGIVGKTGTSQDHRDAWFIGRSGDVALAVWVGRDDSRPMPAMGGRAATGGSLAAPIAAQIFQAFFDEGLSSARISTRPFGSDADAGAALNTRPDWVDPDWANVEPLPGPDYFPPAPGSVASQRPADIPLVRPQGASPGVPSSSGRFSSAGRAPINGLPSDLPGVDSIPVRNGEPGSIVRRGLPQIFARPGIWRQGWQEDPPAGELPTGGGLY